MLREQKSAGRSSEDEPALGITSPSLPGGMVPPFLHFLPICHETSQARRP